MNLYAIIAAAALLAAGTGQQAPPTDNTSSQYLCEDVHDDALGRVETHTYITDGDDDVRPKIWVLMDWSMPVRSEGLYLSASQLVESGKPLAEPNRIDIHFAIGSSRMKKARIELQRSSAARNECCEIGSEIMFASPFLRPIRPPRAIGREILAPVRLNELRILMGESELLVTLLRSGAGTRPDNIVGREKITSDMLALPMQAFAAARTRIEAKILDYRATCEKMPPSDEGEIIVATLGNVARSRSG